MDFQPKGILPALITPLTREGKVNVPVLKQLINYTIDGGVHGIFAIGTTGEFYGLCERDYEEILAVTVETVNGRVPVYAGANAVTTKESIKLVQLAQKAGVDALSVLTPLFITPSQEQIYQHFKAIAETTKLPILLYNNSPKTHVTITPQNVAKLAQISNIVGIKDSTGDLTITGEYIRLTEKHNFSVMMGRDTLIYGALCYGATGGVAAIANIAPRLVCDIYNCYMAGDHQGAREAQYKIAPLRLAFNLGTFPAVIKEGLEMLGILAGECCAPVGRLSVAERTELRRILIDMGLVHEEAIG